VCVLVGDRTTRLDPNKVPLPFSPDIAIEVISASELASESYNKGRASLRNGTAEVWQVYPKSRNVLIHRGETARVIEPPQPVETDLLPGFSLQLESLFA
jgi:Uma2 family endonuclease